MDMDVRMKTVLLGAVFLIVSLRSLKLINTLVISALSKGLGGSVAEWLACWAQAQKGPSSNRSRDAVG